MSTDINRQLARYQRMQATTKAVYVAMYAAARTHHDASEACFLAATAKRIETCHRTTRFKIHRPNDDAPWLQVTAPFACMTHWCMRCARARSKRFGQYLGQALLVIWRAHPEMRGSFLTLSSKNAAIAQTNSMLEHHVASMDRYAARKEVKRSHYGALIGIELPIRAKGKEIGVHSHHTQLVDDACMQDGRYLRIERITQLWGDCLRVDYLPMCFIEAVKADADQDMLEAMRSAVRETAKYCLKPLSLMIPPTDNLFAAGNPQTLRVDPEVVRHVALAIRGRRLVRLTGLWKRAAAVVNAANLSAGNRRPHTIPTA